MRHTVIAAPEHKLYGGITYTAGRWRLATDAQLIRGLATQLSPITRENFLLWNCDISYRLASYCQIYTRGENLLAERYEVNAGYPMPRATLFAGVKLSF
jgi:iron complex outermembrane receptor protein